MVVFPPLALYGIKLLFQGSHNSRITPCQILHCLAIFHFWGLTHTVNSVLVSLCKLQVFYSVLVNFCEVFLQQLLLIPYDFISLAPSYFALSMDSEVPLRIIYNSSMFSCFLYYSFLLHIIAFLPLGLMPKFPLSATKPSACSLPMRLATWW